MTWLTLLLFTIADARAAPAIIVDVVDQAPPSSQARRDLPVPSYSHSPKPEPSPAPAAWDRGSTGNFLPLSEKTEVSVGDSLMSGGRVAVRLALFPERSTLTLAEGETRMRVFPTLEPGLHPASGSGQEPTQDNARVFRLDSGAMLANLFAPHHPPAPVVGGAHALKKKSHLPPPFFAVLEMDGVFIGARKSALIFLLAPGAHGEGDPAALYALSTEIEVATTLETLLKGNGLRVPTGHGVLVTGPNGIESPRPFSSEHDLLLKYPSLRKIRGRLVAPSPLAN